ncbi:peptidyl-prolyl cis-trans isomerase FKBP2 [Episyrphus balteatus]|uniref:peptidyl-prolyl cis-trans isomerase FKBP2 n=1 Tax=Episyrphus balteatus TaxID=286459 RepID=UPI002485D84A|nr:peptidyl-prolyl cis-trans isomerase FKBP2 [Episyrphus balteatus]
MNLLSQFLLFIIAISPIICNDQPKVKIGIKKRIDDCTTRTKKGDFIHVHYKGSLEDGTVFDSSLTRGSPFTFTLGTNQVIKGWEQGLMGMCEGEKRRLVIPPELGYGKHGSGQVIPPNAVLVFEVELMKIEKRQDL